MKPFVVLILAVLLLAWLPAAAPLAHARTEPTPGVRIVSQENGVRLEWNDPASTTPGLQTDLDSTPPDLPLVEIGGLRLPARLVALRIPGEAPVAPRIEHLEHTPWRGTLAAAEVPIPQTATGEPRPALAMSPPQKLPSSPVVVLRDSRMRGQRIVVVAISPLYAQAGSTYRATGLQATIPGAVLLAENSAALHDLLRQLSVPSPFLAADTAPAPVNPLAARPALKIAVDQAGIQRISGAMLAAAGLDLAGLDLARLHLWHNDTAVALEEQGTTDGTLDMSDELRFYAPEPGDRWNEHDTYWLTSEATPGPRMAVRDTSPGSAPLRSTASQHGTWHAPRIYDSNLPGPDDDHWFSSDLRAAPGQAALPLSVPLTPTLPLAAGITSITLTGSSYTTGTHGLALQMGNTTRYATVQDTGDWTRTFSFEGPGQDSLQITLLPPVAPTQRSGLLLDGLAWQRPVTLAAEGQSVTFEGEAGRWRYQLTGIAETSALYDISDPTVPVRLTAPVENGSLVFEDGEDSVDVSAARRYMLANGADLHTPTLAAHEPRDLVAPLNADVLFIVPPAPLAFQAVLTPLLELRQAQGHHVAVVDAQAIYDAWSYGQVAPEALRSFLRYAAATWNPAPAVVTLVGDGTVDPRNYTGWQNANLIPPYLATIDPWLGETACDGCYARLDGDDPLADGLPDVTLGRLPVNSPEELAALVAKIVAYETASDGGAWRGRAVYLADNYRDAAGNIDAAGDFAAASEASAALQPAGIEIERLYYDPSPDHEGIPWREPDAGRAHQRTLAALNAGAGTVMYTGHSHHWQWAVTDLQADPSYLLGLYDPDNLVNGPRQPVVLAMTCLSSAFQTPAPVPTTVDERLLLRSNGGAVAVWGPTGLGVAHGHDSLQRGFYQALWDTRPITATFGNLTAAGYLELFTRGYCCQDTLHTFVLLGDPLTPVRVSVPGEIYLPIMRRSGS